MTTSPLIPGVNGQPKVILTTPDGSRAEVYLHGAHVTSWIPSGGEERMYLSAASEFRDGAAIRGGVPVRLVARCSTPCSSEKTEHLWRNI